MSLTKLTYNNDIRGDNDSWNYYIHYLSKLCITMTEIAPPAVIILLNG